MGLFKPKEVQVVLSDESRRALESVEGNLVAVEELLHEVIAEQQRVLGVIEGEIAVTVARATGVPVDGITVTKGDEPPEEVVLLETGPAENKKNAKRPKLPEAMTANTIEDTSVGDNTRRRTSPWTRTPRHVQVEWLKKRMADGGWYAAFSIADEEATDEKHRRYLRHAVGGRMKEMYEENIVDRRDSEVKGAMFEYRLRTEAK